ncbi:hypothetical protein RBB84_17350 [Rhodococcus sp. D-6]|uniref:Transposase n=1 Tax=Rhodococcus sp. D-6 TaxID=1387842 RepID=A0AAU7V3U0_9NOCA|nr:hypothetical protein [Rhodococcus sp. HS-D2]
MKAQSDRLVFDENDVEVTDHKSYAAGVPAVLVSLKRGLEQMGPMRTARTLTRLTGLAARAVIDDCRCERQVSPCSAASPSLTAIAAMTRVTTGSAHDHPKALLTSSTADR